MVVAVTAVLQDEAAEWVANLHNDHARNLADVGLFLEALRSQFKDVSHVQQAEGELLALKHQGRFVAKYVWEFRWVASRCGPGQNAYWFTSSGQVWTMTCVKHAFTTASQSGYRTGFV
ncbi:RTL1: Retrotransposon-like 1 [Crotalus adamanteus]|uniref:RTL1: Retrotransposon-like 1 n=1 Tax=Crotalus adamanteus TaxID=8729 RepID=A0AAW1C4S7_CROAD